jgi:beta-glucosidase
MKDVKVLVSRITLEEKASLCSGQDIWYLKGIERLGIPSIMMTDGPNGLRKQSEDAKHIELTESVPATCFPTPSALAATWNRELVYEVGVALGEECRQEKVGVILGPGVNIKRSPLCGRNFEYFSEDPYLSGEMAKSHIKGVQSQGIGTSLKHYAVNNQEYRRMTINAIVDERALREIYLTGYEIAVKEAQPWTVMCAYNKINGIYASDHQQLMRTILKEEWGHDGIVVTDWGAMNDRPVALDAGTDLEMPGVANGNDERIVAAVQAGILGEAVLDEAVERILTMILKVDAALAEDFSYDVAAHHILARKVAGEGAVLLKNDGSILPLKENKKVAILGRFAKEPRYQGAGSSWMNPTQLDNLYDEIVKIVGAENVMYAPGYSEKGDQPDEVLITEAIDVANEAETIIVCAGLTDFYETEGLDRDHLKMPPGHDALIGKIAAAHENVVVVLSNGSPVEMPWRDVVPAILEGYLGGQAGAGGVADILFGKVNPSGKLAETFPLKLEDNPSYHYFPGGPVTVEYRESIYVGYRYYDTVGQDVLFPFGHGLSYTTFEYADLKVSADQFEAQDKISVTFKVRNTGIMAGQEVVQVYVRDIESSAFRPEKELKGFAKVALEPGEEKAISTELDQRAFAYYNPDLGDWHVEAGDFEIVVGASAQDIRLTKMVTVTAEQSAPQVDRAALDAYYNFPKGMPVSQGDFEALMGRPLPSNIRPKKGNYDLNTPISDMDDSWIGRALFRLLKKMQARMLHGQEESVTTLIWRAGLQTAPARAILLLDNASFNRESLEALLMMINGHFIKGLGALIKAIRTK